jgi:hypothetical protein
MVTKKILKDLENKKNKPEDYVDLVISNPDQIPHILTGMSSENACVKFGCSKMLRIISEKEPEVLYHEIDFFIKQLDNENNILKWIAIDVIGNLTKVDTEKRFDELFEKYYSLLSDEVMITAGHVIDNSGKIAISKPYLTTKITKNLLSIENIAREQECQNILLGKTILAFKSYFKQIENKNEIISFVERQINNSRSATRKKAEEFLKRNKRG